MDVIAVRRSRLLNALEGVILSAVCQGFPTFASAVLMLRLVHDRQLTSDPGRAAIFVPLASLVSALLTCYFGPKFPNFFKHGYEPAFFDPALTFNDKVTTWRERPTTSVQLVTTMIMLSLLAVAVVSGG
jgi:hypothetical protein